MVNKGRLGVFLQTPFIMNNSVRENMAGLDKLLRSAITGFTHLFACCVVFLLSNWCGHVQLDLLKERMPIKF